MTSVIPRFDSSDPKRPDLVKAFRHRAGADTYAVFSSGGGMALGAAAMFTKLPAVAFLALAISLAGLLNAPDIAASSNNTSPWTGVMMSVAAVLNALLVKITNPDAAAQIAAQRATTSAAAALSSKAAQSVASVTVSVLS